MTNLKTLKDLKMVFLMTNDPNIFRKFKRDDGSYHAKDIPTECHIKIGDLRAEAIKWIKEDYITQNSFILRNWIKVFFNITDEELSK